MSFCWVSLWWRSLCWMSWRPLIYYPAQLKVQKLLTSIVDVHIKRQTTVSNLKKFYAERKSFWEKKRLFDFRLNLYKLSYVHLKNITKQSFKVKNVIMIRHFYAKNGRKIIVRIWVNRLQEEDIWQNSRIWLKVHHSVIWDHKTVGRHPRHKASAGILKIFLRTSYEHYLW